MGDPIFILGASGVIFHFISFFHEIHFSKQNSPIWDAALGGVTSGAILFACVPKKGRHAYRVKKRLNTVSTFGQRAIA